MAMKQFALVSILVAIGTVLASPSAMGKEPPSKRADLPTVTTSGNAFWAGKERFYIRGIDYQPGGSSADKDPLADSKICSRDIKKFKELGVNTIRVYTVDNSANHDECMTALADAGIYLVLDVNTPKYSLNRVNPGPSYNTDYLQNVFATIDMFSQYRNTLAFFSGNEVINHLNGTDQSAPYIKAITRDIKNYISSHGLRKIPVGYSAADVSDNRLQTAYYMNCGSDDMRSDFFAFNDYSWCNSDFKTSGWEQKVETFGKLGLPIFLSEWGCQKAGEKRIIRKFDEVKAMMSEDMTSVYSGGLLYEYSVEENDYGLVKIKGDDVDTKGDYDEFRVFASALKDNPAPTGAGGAASTTHAVPCPTKESKWNVDPSLVPAMPKQAEKFMKDGAGKGLGLSGPGSQDSFGSGTSTTDVIEGKPSPRNGSKDYDSPSVSLQGNMDKRPMVVSALTLFTMFVAALL
ncbi:hypothetical protein HIM_09443 [Hirsutella minnesotensis 3608]|uniref:1,3-beta-glucanosyltransferase n=1 Tax=Hirsutella minnesotensis 3608 TaxID=1043627 RepID=A0A0F7ZSD8_9HYPO|nr:hypothetical protein HIM_09443 [Hirsutella minnesotensis 3608]